MSTRARKTAMDMARSLGVLLAVILPAVFVWALVAPDASVPPQAVNPAPALSQAVAAGGFAVVAPSRTPQGWIATSARFSGPTSGVAASAVQIGYVTADEQYAGYEQTDAPREDVLTEALGTDPGSRTPGVVSVGGVAWERWTSDRGETVLVQAMSDSTVVVGGSASDEDLMALAAGVRPV